MERWLLNNALIGTDWPHQWRLLATASKAPSKEPWRQEIHDGCGKREGLKVQERRMPKKPNCWQMPNASIRKSWGQAASVIRVEVLRKAINTSLCSFPSYRDVWFDIHYQYSVVHWIICSKSMVSCVIGQLIYAAKTYYVYISCFEHLSLFRKEGEQLSCIYWNLICSFCFITVKSFY